MPPATPVVKSTRETGRAAPDEDQARSVEAAARWSRAIILLTALLVPLLFVPWFGDAFALPRLAALYLLVPLALGGPLAALVLDPRALRASLRPSDAAALAFGVLAVLATLVSAAPGHDLQGEPLQYQGLLPLLLYLATYGVARFAVRDIRQVRRLFAAVVLTGAIAGAYAILQQLRLDPIWHGLDKGRVFGTLGQADNLAAYLVLALPPAGALALIGRGRLRAGALVGFLLALAGLLLSYSRGGYLGAAAELAVALAALVALRWHRRGAGRTAVPWRRLGSAALGVVVVLLLVAAVPATRDVAVRAWQRAASSANLQEGSIADRLDLWAVGARITLDHPLLGTGPDSYALEFPAYRDTVLPRARAAFMARFRPESPHDVYLAYSAGLGLPALAAYLALIGGALAAAGRALRRADPAVRVVVIALVAAIVGHLVTDAFMTGELAGAWLFWALLGIAVGLPRIVGGTLANGGPAAHTIGRHR